jgi:hypothetical protein
MKYEIDFRGRTSGVSGEWQRLPRLFASFDETWETTRKLMDLYFVSVSSMEEISIRFRKIKGEDIP